MVCVSAQERYVSVRKSEHVISTTSVVNSFRYFIVMFYLNGENYLFRNVIVNCNAEANIPHNRYGMLA